MKTKEEAEKDYQNAKDSNQTTGIVSQSPTYYDVSRLLIFLPKMFS